MKFGVYCGGYYLIKYDVGFGYVVVVDVWIEMD